MAYTVLDSKNINKTKNIYTFGGSGTKPEREDIAENSKLIDYSSGQKFYYDPSKAAGSKWQPDKEPSGGSSGGEGLPDNFPAEGSANANKFLGFDANGDYTAKDAPSGGGGAEKFVVTLTESNDTWTADKTIAEIMAAYEANQVVVCKYTDSGVLYELALVMAYADPEGTSSVCGFSSVWDMAGQTKETRYAIGQQDGSDIWLAGANSIPTSSNAPLVVTLTESSGTLTGDKTYQEVKAARLAGRPVDLVMTGYTCASVIDVSYNGSTISVTFIANGQLATATGAPSDYVSKTLG